MRMLPVVLGVLVAAAAGPSVGAEWTDYVVRGRSMAPTLVDGDVVRLSKQWSAVRRDDLVGVRFRTASAPRIKRVVAVAGDRVAMVGDRLDVNGLTVRAGDGQPVRVASSSPLRPQIGRYGGVVPPGGLIVFGDNPTASEDSRMFGLVWESQIIGVAMPALFLVRE